MTKLYRGAGLTEYTDVELKTFAQEVSSVQEESFHSLNSQKFCLNSRMNTSFIQDYNFSPNDFLIGYKSIVYWKNKQGNDLGSIGVSLPAKNLSDEDESDMLPVLADVFTQDLFKELDIEDPLEYEISSIDVNTVPQIDEVEGELQNYGDTTICVTIQHKTLDATLKWYSAKTPDYLNIYGCVYNDDQDTIFSNSALISCLILPRERRLETDVDVDLTLIGGLDWDSLNQGVMQTFTNNISDVEDETDPLITDENTVVLGEKTRFNTPEGIITVKVCSEEYHSIERPTDWVKVESNKANTWDNLFYYTQDGEVEKIKGRLERTSDVFLIFEATTKLGFMGNDNYYRLINLLDDLRGKQYTNPEVLSKTVLQ